MDETENGINPDEVVQECYYDSVHDCSERNESKDIQGTHGGWWSYSCRK